MRASRSAAIYKHNVCICTYTDLCDWSLICTHLCFWHLCFFSIQNITDRNALPVLSNATKLLLKTIDGRASESGVLPMTRAEEQKTAAASALAGGELLWGLLRGSVSVTAALTAWKNEGGKKEIKSDPHNQIRMSLFFISWIFILTVFSGGKRTQISWCPSSICSS